MFKKWWFSFSHSLALVTLILLFVSLIFPQVIEAKILWLMMCIITPVSVFEFFTFELQLFSKHLWVRRAIAITFSVITLLSVNILFGNIRWDDKKDWIIYGISVAIVVILLVFLYYVADKIEKRNLDAINQKLANGNMDINRK
jgi:O-antigen/teichoic acid export membrane protein